MSQQHIIDVKKVIEESTQVKTIQELEKEGRRAVKVVRASRISELISLAVDNVIQERSMEVVETERNQLIHATGEEFKRLLADADNERKKGEENRQKVVLYEKTVLELQHKLELGEHVHSEDVRILDEQRKVVDELKEKVELLKHELEELVRRQQGEYEEREQLREDTNQLREETRYLRSQLAEAEEQRRLAESKAEEHEREAEAAVAAETAEGDSIKDLMGEVRAIRDSFERGLKDQAEGEVESKTPGGDPEMMSKIEGVIHSSMDQIVKQLADQFQHMPGPVGAKPVEAAKIVLDGLFSDPDRIESNLGNITVESTEGTGIGSSLQRLKQLHKKGITGSGGASGATGGNDSEVSKGENDG